ncbi:unnamed protein product [Ectocarpus sp. 12 AP-2014]
MLTSCKDQRNSMGPKIALKVVKKIVVGIICGVSSIAISTLTNAILVAVILVRFVVMTLLRSLASTVSFVGETSINTLSFIRETIFSILTFIVQTTTSSVLFVLSQLVSVWRLVVTILTATLGETCYLATNGIGRFFDFFSDYFLSLGAFRSGVPGLAKVLKAQADDVKTGVNLGSIIKQAIQSFVDTLVYILKGDENKFSDGIVPNLFTEVFKMLPLSFDLGKLILQGTFDISKETLGVAFSSLTELASLRGIMAGCRGKAS